MNARKSGQTNARGHDIVLEPDELPEQHAGEECAEWVGYQFEEQLKRQIGDEQPYRRGQNLREQQRIDPCFGEEPVKQLVTSRRDRLEIIGDQIIREQARIDEAPHPKDMLARVVLDEIGETEGESQREPAVKRCHGKSGDQPPAPHDLTRHAAIL